MDDDLALSCGGIEFARFEQAADKTLAQRLFQYVWPPHPFRGVAEMQRYNKILNTEKKSEFFNTTPSIQYF